VPEGISKTNKERGGFFSLKNKKEKYWETLKPYVLENIFMQNYVFKCKTKLNVFHQYSLTKV
jgi:hypothetical protein